MKRMLETALLLDFELCKLSLGEDFLLEQVVSFTQPLLCVDYIGVEYRNKRSKLFYNEMFVSVGSEIRNQMFQISGALGV